jgi:hypothetical protein
MTLSNGIAFFEDPDDWWGAARISRSETRSGGFVTVPYEGLQITTMLTARKMELILLLNEELLADMKNGESKEVRGWRSVEDLIPLLDHPTQQVETLRRTIWEINRDFRRAAAKVLSNGQMLRLIETKRQIGVRLHWPLRLA